MPEITNPLDAAIAHLELQRNQIDSLIEQIKRFRDSGGLPPNPANVAFSGGVAIDLSTIPSDAFFKMTIADAAVKFLNIWANRKPQSTNTIIDALERGGFEKKAYQTVYGILNRRANKEKDVVNVKGDWGLAEWYGSGPKTPKRKPQPKVASMLTFEKSEIVEPPEPEELDESQETRQILR